MTDDNSKWNTIHSQALKLNIRVKKRGYIPKSGLLVVEELRKMTVRGRVIDIGTGESGIIAHSLLQLGASEVFASDVDAEVLWQAAKSSDVSKCISWHHCSLFPTTETGDDIGLFDIVTSNPPQMPMPKHGHPHDYGGIDGRMILEEILRQSKQHLSPRGTVILLCFDFLGIDRQTNEKPTIIQLANKLGFKARVLNQYKRTIRKNGKTEENIPWINTVYPGYIFLKDADGNYYHEILILAFEHI